MDNTMNKSNESSISTTGTTATATATPIFSDTMENNVKYINLNFVDNSESSSQAKEAAVEFQKMRAHFQNPKVTKPPPSKILPTNLPLGKNDVSKPKVEHALKEKSLIEMGFKCNEIAGWENIVQPPKENLYKLLKNMIDNHIKPNVQIRIGGVTFNCHMMVLQCYSDFFMECNNEVLIQLPEEKITPGAFMMVYDWMLAEEPLVQREGILELFNAANFLRIQNLVNQCWLCLDDDVRFREDTAFLLYLEARNYHLESLEQLMLTRICKFFLTLAASKEFLDLTAKELATLLSSNTIGVNSEIEIFMSIVRWMSYCWDEREPDLVSVIKCVRFSLMPPWFLVTLNKNTECEEIDRIASHPEVKRMISDGISYTTTQLYYGENREEFLHFLERYQLVTPMQRQWVFDKECNYHHRLECPNMQYVTYKSFLEYLEMIQMIGKDYWRSLEMARGVEKSKQCCVRPDCRQSTDQNLASVFTRANRHQSIQVEQSIRQRKALIRVSRGNIASATNNKNQITLSQKYASDLAATTLNRDEHPQPQPPQQQQEQRMLSHNNNKATQNLIDLNDNESKAPPPPPAPMPPLPPTQNTFKSNAKHSNSNNNTNTNNTKQCYDQEAFQLSEVACCNGQTIDDGHIKKALTKSNQQTISTQTKGDDKKPDALPDHSADDGGGDRADKLKVQPVNVQTIVPILKAEFNKITNRKILIFGGIDPYCQHCMHEEKHPATPCTHLQQQHLMMRKRVFLAGAGGGAIANIGTEIENYGDQVLLLDTSVMQWRHLSYIPFGSRHHHAAVVCNGLIYVIGGTRTALGGCTKKSVFEKSVYSFNPQTLQWSLECSLPESRRDFAVIAIDDKCERCKGVKGRKGLGPGFFVIGGEGLNGVALDTVWFYDAVRRNWTKKASLNIGRYGLTATIVNNEIWIAGGIIDDKKKRKLVVGSGGGANSFGAGGDDGGHGETTKILPDMITDSIEYYSLKCAASNESAGAGAGASSGAGGGDGICVTGNGGGQWIMSKLRLRTPRLFGRFCKMSSTELYLVGGIGFNNNVLTSFNSVDQFNFEETKWQHFADINWARHGHDIAALNERILIIGGVSTIEKRTLTRVEAFCPKTRRSLADLPELPWPLSGSAVVALD